MASVEQYGRPPPPQLPAAYELGPSAPARQATGHGQPGSQQHADRHGNGTHQHRHHSSSAKAKPPDKDKDKRRSSHHAGKKPGPAPAPAPPISPTPALDNRLRRETPFLATIRFKNDIPEIPGDPKLMVVQQPPDKLAAFSLTGLEKEPKRDLILPPDLGITISLLDVERYAVPADKPALHPADQALLGPDADSLLTPGAGPLAGVSKAGLGLGGASPSQGPRRGTALRSAAEVSWLMRTTYISADSDAVKARAHANEYEARRKKEQAKAQEVAAVEADEEAQRQTQIREIEATFAAARNPPVHRTKPGMRAVEVMEVLPDFDMWGQRYMVAHFDKDPAEEVEQLQSLEAPLLAHQVAGRCILRGFKLDESKEERQAGARGPGNKKERFVAFLLPEDVQHAAAVTQDRGSMGLDVEDIEGDYKWVREYVYEEVDPQAGRGRAHSTTQQSYLVHFTAGRALYSEVSSQLELRKREGGVKGRPGTQLSRPSQVTLRRREATQQEVDAANKRRRVLHVGGQQAWGYQEEEEEDREGYAGGPNPGYGRQGTADEDQEGMEQAGLMEDE